MDKFLLKAGIALVSAMIAVQGFIFYREYESVEYSNSGMKMTEETYLYEYDELTISFEGNPENFFIYKNGDIIVRNVDKKYTFTIRENDLVEISADSAGGESTVVMLTLKDNKFDPKYYARIFDFDGGKTAVGRFVRK